MPFTALVLPVMRHGALVEQNTRAHFFKSPQHEYSQQLIRALPDTKNFITTTETDILLQVNNLHVYFPVRNSAQSVKKRAGIHTANAAEVWGIWRYFWPSASGSAR